MRRSLHTLKFRFDDNIYEIATFFLALFVSLTLPPSLPVCRLFLINMCVNGDSNEQ